MQDSKFFDKVRYDGYIFDITGFNVDMRINDLTQ